MQDVEFLRALGLQNFSTQVNLRHWSSIVMLIWTKFTWKLTFSVEFSRNILPEHALQMVFQAMKPSEFCSRKKYGARRFASSRAMRSIRWIIVAQRSWCKDDLFGCELSSGIEQVHPWKGKKIIYDGYRPPMYIVTKRWEGRAITRKSG